MFRYFIFTLFCFNLVWSQTLFDWLYQCAVYSHRPLMGSLSVLARQCARLAIWKFIHSAPFHWHTVALKRWQHANVALLYNRDQSRSFPLLSPHGLIYIYMPKTHTLGRYICHCYWQGVMLFKWNKSFVLNQY